MELRGLWGTEPCLGGEVGAESIWSDRGEISEGRSNDSNGNSLDSSPQSGSCLVDRSAPDSGSIDLFGGRVSFSLYRAILIYNDVLKLLIEQMKMVY